MAHKYELIKSKMPQEIMTGDMLKERYTLGIYVTCVDFDSIDSAMFTTYYAIDKSRNEYSVCLRISEPEEWKPDSYSSEKDECVVKFLRPSIVEQAKPVGHIKPAHLSLPVKNFETKKGSVQHHCWIYELFVPDNAIEASLENDVPFSEGQIKCSGVYTRIPERHAWDMLLHLCSLHYNQTYLGGSLNAFTIATYSNQSDDVEIVVFRYTLKENDALDLKLSQMQQKGFKESINIRPLTPPEPLLEAKPSKNPTRGQIDMLTLDSLLAEIFVNLYFINDRDELIEEWRHLMPLSRLDDDTLKAIIAKNKGVYVEPDYEHVGNILNMLNHLLPGKLMEE